MNAEERVKLVLQRINNNEYDFNDEEYLLITYNNDVLLAFIHKVLSGDIPLNEETYDIVQDRVGRLAKKKIISKAEHKAVKMKLIEYFLVVQGYYETDVEYAISNESGLNDEETKQVVELVESCFRNPSFKFPAGQVDDDFIIRLMKSHRYDVIEGITGQKINGYTPSDEVYELLKREWPYENKPAIMIVYEKNNHLYKYSKKNTYKELITELKLAIGSYRSISDNCIPEEERKEKQAKMLAYVEELKNIIKNKINNEEGYEELIQDPVLLENLFNYYSTSSEELLTLEEKVEIAAKLYDHDIISHAYILEYQGLISMADIKEKINYCVENHLYIPYDILDYVQIDILDNRKLLELLIDYGELDYVLRIYYYTKNKTAEEERVLEELIPYITNALKTNDKYEKMLTNIGKEVLRYPAITKLFLEQGKTHEIDLSNVEYGDEIIDLVLEEAKRNPGLKILLDMNNKSNSKLGYALMNKECYRVFFVNGLAEYVREEDGLEFIRENYNDLEFLAFLIDTAYQELKCENPEILNEIIGIPYITEKIVSEHIRYEEADISYLTEESVSKLIKYYSNKKEMNERNLRKLADRFGPGFVRYLSSEEFIEFINLPEEEFDQIIALLPQEVYTMKDVQAGYESLIQYLFSQDRADDVNIFGNFISAIDASDKEEIIHYKEKLIIGTKIDFLFTIVDKYNLEGISDTEDLLNLIISKIGSDDEEEYIDMLHDLADEYVQNARDHYHNYHFFEEIHPALAYVFQNFLFYIKEKNDVELGNLIKKVVPYLDEKFYVTFMKNKNLPDECKDPEYLLTFLVEKVKDPTKYYKYLPFLKEATDYYLEKVKNTLAKEIALGEELHLPYTYEDRNVRSNINKFYIIKSHLFEIETGELLQDVIIDTLASQGIDKQMVLDCIHYYGKEGTLVNPEEEVKKNASIVIKTANQIVREHKIYNTHGEEPIEDLIVANLNSRFELTRIYYVDEPIIDPYKIISMLNIPLIRKNLLKKPERYKELLEIMTKKKVHLIPSCLTEAFTTCGIEPDHFTIASLINYFVPIITGERKRLKTIGKNPDEALTGLASILIQATTYGSISGIYSQILTVEDARLIKANPEPYSATDITGEERLRQAIYLTADCFTRKESTVPPIDQDFELDDGRKINVILGNLTDPCNISHGERTLACMRIGGIADNLMRFCIQNPNGFFLRFEEPETREYITRVAGFRNGNTIFFNQLRYSCNSDLYETEDLIPVLRKVARKLIELTKDSPCPIQNVVINSKYGMEKHKDEVVSFGIADNKEGFSRFYTDIGRKGIVLATTAKDQPLEPINFDKTNVPTYPMCRGKIKLSSDSEFLKGKINRVASIKAIIDGANYEELEGIDFSDGIICGIVADDWYIYVTDNKEIIYDYIDIDPRAKEEVASHLQIIEQIIARDEIGKEVGHGIQQN